MSMCLYEAGFNDRIMRRAVCTICFLECPGYQGTKIRVTSKTGLFTQPKAGQLNYVDDNVKLFFVSYHMLDFIGSLAILKDYWIIS